MKMFRLFIRRTKVTLSKDGSCIVAHHPETEHPYKHTLAFPQTNKDESLLRVDSKNMITKSPNLEQLQTLTYTPASYWRQEQGLDKRRKFKESFDDKAPNKPF